MSTPITLAFSGILPTTEIETMILDRLRALESFGDVADWHAALESIESHSRALFRLKIVANLPGGDVLADHDGDRYWWTKLETAIENSLARIEALVAGPHGTGLNADENAQAIPEVLEGLEKQRIHADIARRVERLRRSFPGIGGFELKLEKLSSHNSPARRATIILHVGGDSLISARTIFPATQDSFKVAARDAFQGVKHQAIRYADRRQQRTFSELDLVLDPVA